MFSATVLIDLGRAQKPEFSSRSGFNDIVTQFLFTVPQFHFIPVSVRGVLHIVPVTDEFFFFFFLFLVP